MNYIAKLQPDDFGNITDSNNYSHLTSEDFADWMRDRFNGRILIVPYHYKDDFRLPGMVFTYLIQDLPEDSQKNLQQGIDICVDEAFEECKKRKPKQWKTEPFDDLLLLVDSAVYYGNYQPPAEKFIRFLDYFSPTEKVEENSIGNYQRVLAVLSELKMPISFWQKELQKAPRQNAGICFSAVYEISPNRALSLLKQMDWSNVNSAEELLGAGIGHLLDTCKNDKKLKASYQKIKK